MSMYFRYKRNNPHAFCLAFGHEGHPEYLIKYKAIHTRIHEQNVQILSFWLLVMEVCYR